MGISPPTEFLSPNTLSFSKCQTLIVAAPMGVAVLVVAAAQEDSVAIKEAVVLALLSNAATKASVDVLDVLATTAVAKDAPANNDAKEDSSFNYTIHGKHV